MWSVRITETIEKRKLIIFCAVEFEARALARALGGDFARDVVVIGVGAVRWPREIPENAVLCMAGLGGGLDPALGVGEVVVDELSDAPGIELPFRRGTMLTVRQIVATPAERAALFARTGAVVVEMENERVREFAREHGAGYVGIRAISDSAGETLDPAVARLVDPFGRVKPGALAKELVCRPGLAKELMRLRRASKRALANLAPAVRALAEHFDGR